MLKFQPRLCLILSVLGASFMLQACSNQTSDGEKVEIKPAPKLTNDATTYAHAAWDLISQVDPLIQQNKLELLEEQVRKPARKLSTDWRLNVKMTDSVTEGKYALCRKALTSMDILAREMIDGGKDIDQKRAAYERDKTQCQGAIENPALGNTDPKSNGVVQ